MEGSPVSAPGRPQGVDRSAKHEGSPLSRASTPAGPDSIARIAARCRKLVNRRALLAAGVAMVPVPGVDWITDIGVLVEVLPEISMAFGLSQAQVERLAPDRRLMVYKAISAGGSMLLGRLVTREVVLMLLKTVGLRLSAQQAAKYLPVAGQLVSAALTFSALKYVCDQHILQCEAVARQLLLPAPALTRRAAG